MCLLQVSSRLIEAALLHLALERAAACVLAVPNTDPQLYVAVGPSPAIARLRKVLLDVRHALQFANDSPGGGIIDTLWMMHDAETVFDHIDAALGLAEVEHDHSEGGHHD